MAERVDSSQSSNGSETHGIYLCCVVEAVDGVTGCPVCGAMNSYRTVPGPLPEYAKWQEPPEGEAL